jgi:hypothetical protein
MGVCKKAKRIRRGWAREAEGTQRKTPPGRKHPAMHFETNYLRTERPRPKRERPKAYLSLRRSYQRLEEVAQASGCRR